MVVVGAGRAAASRPAIAWWSAHHVPCFACHYCRRGSPSMCRHFKRINLDPGGFAERLRVPAPNVRARRLPRCPRHLADETASFTEPLACCLRAVERARVAPGDTVLVVGLGSIGCLLVQLLNLAGAAVLGDDVLPARRGARPLAWAPGWPTSPAAVDAAAGRGQRRARRRLRRSSPRAAPRSCPRRRRACATAGRCTTSRAARARALPLPLATLYHRELTLTSTYSSSPAELVRAFELLVAGRVRVDGLISHRLPLGRLGEGVELMRRHEAVKVYVTP